MNANLHFFILVLFIGCYSHANPQKKEPPASESIEDTDGHFHHYLNTWCKEQKAEIPKDALHFFKRHSCTSYSVINYEKEVWVTFEHGERELEIPLNDDHLIFVDDDGWIRDKNGSPIPPQMLFDEGGYFKGYGALKPDKTRAFGRDLYGRWFKRFFRRGHSWCRRL